MAWVGGCFFIFLFLCSIIWIPGARAVYFFGNDAECNRIEDIFWGVGLIVFLGFLR